MIINDLYKKYFQKSKLFMYPLLGIQRGNVTPKEAYLSIGDKYKPENRKLILMYQPGMDDRYETFKQNQLFNHKLLIEWYKDPNENEIYIFDMSGFGSDWDLFIIGKYSQMSLKVRSEIINYFEKNSSNYIYMHSFLFPEKWFERYAEILNVSEELLKEVGELCDVPDLAKEHINLCAKCYGHGYISKYNHISNGICFECYGAKEIKSIVA